MNATLEHLGEARQAGEAIAGRIAALLRTADPNRELPGSAWTVAETAAHLAYTTIGLGIMARGLAIPYGDGTREGLQEANADGLEGYTERDLNVLADQLVTNTAMAFGEVLVQPPDRICPTPMGEVGVDGLAGYLLMHQSMHGAAIARAVGGRLPFEPADLALMWPFIEHVMPDIYRPSFAPDLVGTFELAMTDGFHFAVTIDGHSARAEQDPSRPVDCRISGDPDWMFLVLIKVVAMRDAVAQGKVHLDGPQADLGYRLMDAFNMP